MMRSAFLLLCLWAGTVQGAETRGPVLLLSALAILTLSLTPWATASAVKISME